MAIRHKTSTGIIWNFAQQLSQRGMGLVITTLLALFLVPETFGLIGLLSFFITLASALMDSGFKEALIRKTDASPIDYSTVFFTNLGLGILAYILLFLIAPLVAEYYQEPRLTNLLRVLGLTIPISSLQIVQVAALSRALNFKAQFGATLPASLTSGIVAVVFAYLGFGEWALIVQMLIASSLTTALLWRQNLWRPRAMFSSDSLSELFSFGSKLFASGLIATFAKNIYVVIIAKTFSASIAGYYVFAQKIVDLVISQLVQSIQTVTYPALSSLSAENSRLKNGYKKVIQVTTFILFPAVLLLAALAEPLFQIFLSDAWLPSANYLQILCLAGLMYPLHAINLNVLKIKGRSDLFLGLEIVKLAFLAVVIPISMAYGIKGILIGQVVFSVLVYIPNSIFTAKLIGYPVSEQVADFLPNLVWASTIAGCTYLFLSLSSFSPVLEILIFGSVSTVAFIAGANVFRLEALSLALSVVSSLRSTTALNEQ